jgi:hypothetical protein
MYVIYNMVQIHQTFYESKSLISSYNECKCQLSFTSCECVSTAGISGSQLSLYGRQYAATVAVSARSFFISFQSCLKYYSFFFTVYFYFLIAWELKPVNEWQSGDQNAEISVRLRSCPSLLCATVLFSYVESRLFFLINVGGWICDANVLIMVMLNC